MNAFFSLHPFRRALLVPGLFSATIGFIFVTPAFSHCDGLDGPVVASARLALQDGNINRVLNVAQDLEDQIFRFGSGHSFSGFCNSRSIAFNSSPPV
jgi:hypothetical protein